jgi:hypothetical protein
MAIEISLSDEEARLLARAAESVSKLMTDPREKRDMARLKLLADRIRAEIKFRDSNSWYP